MYLTNKTSLRKATADDIAQILEIESKATPAPWTQDGFSKELSKPYSHFLVLTDDETDCMVLGYIVFWILKDECEIFNLAVHLEHRGLGYAKIMLRKALDKALHANVKTIVLDVRKSNEAAISLYQSLGFVIKHIRKNFYSKGQNAYEDAYHMNLLCEFLNIE